MAKEVVTESVTKVVKQTYVLPELGITVEATSALEAAEIANKQRKESK